MLLLWKATDPCKDGHITVDPCSVEAVRVHGRPSDFLPLGLHKAKGTEGGRELHSSLS